jgi:RNA polymerase sigma-70 factor (ECF subfamily)
MLYTATGTSTPEQRFDELYHRCYRRALRLAYRITGHGSDAEDATQTACLRAWQHFDTFDDARSFETWLLAITRNCAIDLLRHNKKHVPAYSLDCPLPGDEGAHSLYDQLVDVSADPEQAILSPVLDEQLERALLELPDLWRDAVLLCDIEQCSYMEIATKLNWDVENVRSRIHQARQRLRRSLNSAGPLPIRRKTRLRTQNRGLAA